MGTSDNLKKSVGADKVKQITDDSGLAAAIADDADMKKAVEAASKVVDVEKSGKALVSHFAQAVAMADGTTDDEKAKKQQHLAKLLLV